MRVSRGSESFVGWAETNEQAHGQVFFSALENPIKAKEIVLGIRGKNVPRKSLMNTDFHGKRRVDENEEGAHSTNHSLDILYTELEKERESLLGLHKVNGC